jgi:type VI secretion system secreted protein Hcp
MSFDAFVKIDGIQGESTDSKHTDWIELLSYGHSAMQQISRPASTAGGAAAGRVDFGGFFITKLIDRATPKIFEFICAGKHIKEIVIEVCRAGGDKQKYLEIKMEQVLIANYTHNGTDSGGAAEFPSEHIILSPGKLRVTYFQQKRTDGQGGGQVAAGWDLTKNAPY